MTIRLSGVILAVTAAALGFTPSTARAPQAPTLRSVAPPAAALVLVPVSGTWTADYENASQILTIDGTAAAKAPDADAVRSLLGDAAPGFVKALAAPGAFPLAIVRDIKDFKAGRLTVQFKLVAGASDQNAGILFNLKPDGSYLYARYNTKDGNVAVWKFENGTRTVLTHGDEHEQLPLNVWHTLDVQVTGTTVTATANGRLTVKHALEAPVSGRVGVWTKTDAVTTFRLFQSNHLDHHVVR